MSELSSQPTSIQSLYTTMYREGKLYVNRRYQRKLVWTLEEKRRLVESIMKRYPIPAILVAERDSGDGYEIIDGLQRLHAIISFIETGFSDLNDCYFDVNYFPTAKADADAGLFDIPQTDKWINQKEVGSVLDYTLSITFMRNATDDEINDVFGRINTYGHRLSDQERRQAGVENEFSKMVRLLACDFRGDASREILPLKDMPSISIDLPMIKHGYDVKAADVVWVSQGILRSTDLRDSMDEQCIADIAACIIGGELIERSKDALDEIYDSKTDESERVNTALEVYGSDRFSREFKFCFDQILRVCNSGKQERLRDIIFENPTTNAFPAIFAVILMAFHELIFQEKMVVRDFCFIKNAIKGLSVRIVTTRRATSPEERRANVNTVKGLIKDGFISGDLEERIYGNHATFDIDTILRRSEIEVSDYELKQGILMLGSNRKKDNKLIEKILQTFCAIANNGPERFGKVLLGVTDKESDARTIARLDRVEPKRVGARHVVGVVREAKILGISVEEYFKKWKDIIKNSELSLALRDSILSHIDYNSFFGLGVIVFTIPEQKELSFYKGHVYFRSGSSTEVAKNHEQIVSLAARFR